MGDVMLKEVAAAMQKVFGLDNTYRVGGDEFVAFKTDGESEKVSSELERISAELGEKGYHISFGVGEQNKAQGDLDMHALVTEAEKNMFAAKQEFYRQPEKQIDKPPFTKRICGRPLCEVKRPGAAPR